MSENVAIYTVGHGTKTIEEFIALLREFSIDTVIDVRRFPASRRHPHFNHDALAASLGREDIGYEAHGERLGGRRNRSSTETTRHPAWRMPAFAAYAEHMETDEFRTALARLVERAPHERLAIMCAETLWWKCHRRLISDAIAIGGTEVIHLLGSDKSQRHEPHESLRVDDNGLLVYDVGFTPPLGT